MQPASCGATHDKLTSTDPLCNGLCAFATSFSLCLSPSSNGSNLPELLTFFSLLSWTLERRNRAFVLAPLICPAGGPIFGPPFIELAVKRRAADFQPPRGFGHLPAIMRNREPDDLGLHLFERPDFSGTRQHRQGAG